MLNKKNTFSALALAAVMFLGACGGSGGGSAASSGSTPDGGKEYIVGLDATYAPFEYEENGQVVGFSADVLKAIAENQGLNLKLVNTPWEGIFATLDKGDRDIISSSVTITDERKNVMDFTDPYFEATQMIVTTEKGSAIQSFNDLKSRTVSVQSGTTGDLVMQKLQGEQSAMIKRFETMPLALKELLNGGVEAAVGDNGVVQNFVNNNPDAKLRTLVDTGFEKEYYGFALRKGRDDDLMAKLNAGLAAIKANGTYDQIYAKWFNTAPAAAEAAPAEAAPASAASAQ